MKKESFLVFLLCLLFFSFQNDDTNPLESDEQVLKALEERIENYRAAHSRNCREKLLETANTMVDSLLIELTKKAIKDTLSKPPKPEKPPKPLMIIPPDTTPLKPLWELDIDSNYLEKSGKELLF